MLLDATQAQFSTLEAWHDFIVQTFLPLDLKVHGNSPFTVTAASEEMGRFTITELRTNSISVTRTSHLASRTEKAVYKASLQLSGMSEITQHHNRAVLHPGQWAIYDTTQPYCVSVSDRAHFLVLQINYDSFSIKSPYLKNALARAFETKKGCGSLVYQLLSTAITQRSTLSETAVDQASKSIVQLINTQLCDVIGAESTQDKASLQRVQLMRIKQYIQQRLHSPDLSIEQICQAFSCSRRYLYNLFSSQDLTPADYIQTQRLESSCRHLSDLSYQRPIAELAYQHGFRDAAAFSHAFKRRYGVSPSAWRQKLLPSVVMR